LMVEGWDGGDPKMESVSFLTEIGIIDNCH
jgi:hypothetical protein